MMVDRSQKTVVAPVVEIPAHRGDRRKVVRQHPPLTARGGHVQYGVEHIAQIRRARAASGLRRGQQRRDMAPFLIRRIACIPAPTTSIFGAGDFSPHIVRSEEQTSAIQSLMRISYADLSLNKKKKH